MKKINYPFQRSEFAKLKAGQEVLLSGFIHTARDQAHKRLVALLAKKKKLPLKLAGQLIYYCGPSATPPGRAIGSCGPTTSSRMDDFSIPLLKRGLLGMIGKGRRRAAVRLAIKKQGAVYFLAPAGCGALLAERVRSKKTVGFADLGPEAIYRLEVCDFPLIVGIDSRGKAIYKDL